jgi:5'-nucleotidase (lipoprotein e(P4) family)
MCLAIILGASACSDSTEENASASDAKSYDDDLGLMWVRYAAEYQALSLQAYHQAEADLPGFLADRSWTAQPGQVNAQYLPPAIVFDVDETVVSGAEFQLAVERPVTQAKLNQWNSEHKALAVPGFANFANKARSAGVELFFLTNRPCEVVEGDDDPCPYKTTVMNDIREAGIEVDADHVWLANERSGWTKEKLARREQLARTHRIIMLIGDDLGDFVQCARATPAAPCTDAATAQSRQRKVAQFSGYWGHGWYILPNPMHGSWKSFPKP